MSTLKRVPLVQQQKLRGQGLCRKINHLLQDHNQALKIAVSDTPADTSLQENAAPTAGF
jgi:hypothetical protein